jgi:hypothetical protein
VEAHRGSNSPNLSSTAQIRYGYAAGKRSYEFGSVDDPAFVVNSMSFGRPNGAIVCITNS